MYRFLANENVPAAAVEAARREPNTLVAAVTSAGGTGRQALYAIEKETGTAEKYEKRFKERAPQLRGHATLLQITPESRSELSDYQQLGHDVQRLVGEVNGRYGDATWTPVRYVNRPYPHCDLTAFYRLARVGVVTPRRDGMNLVAKEFIAAQDPEDPGVLVLSQFAGAARELDSALLVNPLDTVRCADAMQRALRMPLAERQLRWSAAMDNLQANQLSHWRDSFLAALATARSTQSTAAPVASAALRRQERVHRPSIGTPAASSEVRSGINA